MTYRLLFDTSSLMYRAFFALPESIRDGEGRPVNAVHGYLDMTASLISTYRPDDAVHVYDHDWRPAPRVAEYAGYKSTRRPDPPALPPQFDLLRQVLDGLGQPQAEAEGWEADDAIGALCALADEAAGDRVDVITGDRDLIQLVRDPVVRVLFTVRGVSQIAVFDEAAVLEKYGIPAARYPDFAILRGDPSDGLPGVLGVGEKTARAIVQAYPSLEELLADAEARSLQRGPANRSPKLVATLRASVDYIRAMQRIVPVRADVDLTTWRREPDGGAVDDLAKARRLEGPVKRFRVAEGLGRS